MIKAQYLRIGNKVLVNKITVTIKSINFNPVNSEYYICIYENSSQYLVSLCEQIHLTEEILLKCGFEKKEFTFDKDKLSIHLPSNSYELGRTYFNSWCIMDAPKYLHQLQNLYFALTGEELTFKQ